MKNIKEELLKAEAVEIKNGRGIDENVKLLLYAKTAGRCELCNELVIKDKITRKDINWGEKAHIYAFSESGPRGIKKKIEKNNVDNLLLACPNCHEKIDKKEQVQYYDVGYLKNRKREHENRIRLSTSFDSSRQTKVLKMVANINKEEVRLSTQDIVVALMKENLIPCEEKQEEIDFTKNSGKNDKTYWKSKSQEIEETLGKFYSDLKREKIEHVSIFGIGPMPLLMFLGSKLDNKIKTKIFQRHRDGECWEWKKAKPEAVYRFRLINKGSDKDKVALLLSLSGHIDKNLLPETFIKDYYIYELSVDNPNYNFLRAEADLYNFEKEYSTAISEIKNKHRGLKSIDVFPAVPAPVAIICGRALNKNSDPRLKIYNTSNKDKFKYSLTIN
ncbi:MAG: SAVED domain-containing protein [Candidatus Paceibacterota bacterium]